MKTIDKLNEMKKGGVKFGFIEGEFRPWEECNVHMFSQTALYGFRAYEGIRAYWSEKDQELYLFRLDEHLDRMMATQKAMGIEIPYNKEDIARIIRELLIKNEYKSDVHIQPSAYIGLTGVTATATPDEVSDVMDLMVAAIPVASTERVEDITKNACISSWIRIPDFCQPVRIKAGSNYLNQLLAKNEAAAGGYNQAIMLNNKGKVSEGLGANLFMIRKGIPATPSITDDILEGITRDTLIHIFREEMGINVVEREIDRSEIYSADEIFLCGTWYEITAVSRVGGISIGDGHVGSQTQKIRQLFFKIVRGDNPEYKKWLTPVYNQNDGNG
jgi:branched-chain amino acid aminotransferase